MENMNNQEFLEMMKRIEAANDGQEKYAKKQYRMSQLSAFASILSLLIVIGCAVIFVPKALHTFEQADQIMTDLESATSELSEALPEMITDVNGLVSDVDGLVISAEGGITESMEKISSLDIDSLNEAIGDLQAIVEPLARMFGR